MYRLFVLALVSASMGQEPDVANSPVTEPGEITLSTVKTDVRVSGASGARCKKFAQGDVALRKVDGKLFCEGCGPGQAATIETTWVVDGSSPQLPDWTEQCSESSGSGSTCSFETSAPHMRLCITKGPGAARASLTTEH